MIFGIGLLVVALFGMFGMLLFYVTTHDSLPFARKKVPASAKTEVKLSAPSRNLIREYDQLPDDIKPYPDLTNMLVALDIKHGITAANYHFVIGNYSYFSWDTRCDHKNCAFSVYHSIHSEIKNLIKARKEQEHVLAVANVQHDLDEVNLLTARLREERILTNDVTKELL